MGAPFLADDEACAAAERQVGPGPLQNYQKPVPKSREVINVDSQPYDPCRKSAHTERADFQNGLGSPDRRHLAFVDKSEGLTWPALQIAQDCPGEISALLH